MTTIEEQVVNNFSGEIISPFGNAVELPMVAPPTEGRVEIDLSEADRVIAECGSCKSGPLVAQDEVSPWEHDGKSYLSDARPGKLATATYTIKVTRRFVQVEPTTITGTLEEIEAAGWEEGEYSWTCKACAEKAAGFEGGAHVADENAVLLVARDVRVHKGGTTWAKGCVEESRLAAEKLITETKSGRKLTRGGLLDLMTKKVSP